MLNKSVGDHDMEAKFRISRLEEELTNKESTIKHLNEELNDLQVANE